MKARYLIFFSYIGSSFRSSEKIWLKGTSNYADPESVQGLMELSLIKLKSLVYPKVVLSSRTDGGVHALRTSAHVDLDKYGTDIYEPNNVTYLMNKYFHLRNISILVNKCLRVNDNFHARYNACGRVYLYRLAVLKNTVQLPENAMYASYMPIEELKRCHYVRLNNFDIERFKEGAKYFVGIHDFTSFKKFDKLKAHKHNRREIVSIDVRPGRPMVTDYTQSRETLFDYWDIEIQGRAFVHNQIRRMVGTLIAVAKGKLDYKDLQLMLQIPSKNSWHSFIATGPPDGLYLCDVQYKPEDLVYSDTAGNSHREELGDDDDDDDDE